MSRVITRSQDKAPAPPPPAEKPPVQPELPLVGFSLGDEHSSIGELQRALGLPVTGVMDNATVRGVQTFQFSNDMDTSGVATPAVFAKLNLAWEG